MKGISIDIGVHNFAICIEEFDHEALKTLKCPKTTRYDANGAATARFRKEILEPVYKNGRRILLQRVDLSTKKGVAFDVQTFINLTEYLDSQISLFDDCSFVIIEQQMKTNPMAQRLEQHCVSWFTFTYRDSKEIIVFPSKNKTRVIGAPKKLPDKLGVYKKMTKPQRKKWASDEAVAIFELRGDDATINTIFLPNWSKRDDISDVTVQLQAFKITCFIDGSLR